MFPHHPNDPVPWPPVTTPIDLTEVVHAFGPMRGLDHRPTPGGYRRVAHLVEDRTRSVHDTAPPALVGFLDGVQRVGLLGRVAALRDVLLAWVAAGTVLGDTFLDHHVRTAAICSELDTAEVSALAPNLPVVALPEITPWGLAAAADGWVDATRRRMERDATEAAPSMSGHVLTLDGSLPADSQRNDLVGVVKHPEAEYLTDPALLPQQEGWRSPGLRLPAARCGERDRLTAYVRLHDATPHHWWGHALVRVEVYADGDVDLDTAASLAWNYRGGPGYRDPRWPVQLKPMWNTERVLKLAIPHPFSTIS